MFWNLWTTKDIVKLILVLGALFLLFYIIICATTVPKELATYEQVWDALLEQGYEPCDVTESYSDYSFVTNCIEAQQGDIRFDFFVCTSDSGASSIFTHFCQLFLSERRYVGYSEYKTYTANYSKYGLKSKGKYSIVVQVGSTLVYAECNEENMQKTNRILDAFDYLNY